MTPISVPAKLSPAVVELRIANAEEALKRASANLKRLRASIEDKKAKTRSPENGCVEELDALNAAITLEAASEVYLASTFDTYNAAVTLNEAAMMNTQMAADAYNNCINNPT